MGALSGEGKQTATSATLDNGRKTMTRKKTLPRGASVSPACDTDPRGARRRRVHTSLAAYICRYTIRTTAFGDIRCTTERARQDVPLASLT